MKIIKHDTGFQLDRKGKTIVLVGGCFDVLHYGHLQFLKAAKKEGDLLVVALESDEFIKKVKRRAPIHNQHERAELLAALEIVDYVLLLPFLKTDEEYQSLVKSIVPDVIAITEGDSQSENKKKHADKIGAKVVVVTPLISKHSTTKILQEIT